jgi:hypothetical protein
VIEVVVVLVCVGALTVVLLVGPPFVGDFRDSREYRRARERRLRERHVRTLEWELDIEPYPWGPLDD